jgi:hypothetical protein
MFRNKTGKPMPVVASRATPIGAKSLKLLESGEAILGVD